MVEQMTPDQIIGAIALLCAAILALAAILTGGPE